MTKYLAFLVILILPAISYAQRVYTCDYSAEADLKIYITNNISDADLVVCKVKSKEEAVDNKGHWYFVDHKTNVDKKIYFVRYQKDADLKIYFTPNKSLAGWRDKQKTHLLKD